MKHLLLISVALLSSYAAYAQDSYTPPPMFDAPAMNAQPGETATPKAAPALPDRFGPRYSPRRQPQTPTQAPPPEEKYTGANNPLLPPVITQGDPALEKDKPVVKPRAPKQTQAAAPPVPTAKPQVAVPKTQVPSAPVANVPTPPPTDKPQEPVVAAPESPPEPAAMPAARVTSKGVVTGPKTMPSVPTTGVVAENTFEEDSGDEPTMMERHQAAAQADIPLVDAPPVAEEPPEETAAAPPPQQTQALSIPFEKGITSLDMMPIEGIVQALKDEPASRLMIEAYGTAIDQGENSDRRIALARAMSLRKAIMAQGVAAHRIDIRALGRKVPDGSPERVDLSVYKG